MSIEAILENYMNNPKWEGKIFMEDEKTCYKDGFNDGVESCQLKIMQLKAQIEGLEQENEQLKKDVIEIEKLSDSRWEENQRLRAELQNNL